jgi:phage-related protein
MAKQSISLERLIAAGAVAGALAIAGVVATGCGSDNNNSSGNINSAIDSIQSQASSVQSQVSSAITQVQTQAQSVQSQVQSVQSQVQTRTQSNGGSGAGYGY